MDGWKSIKYESRLLGSKKEHSLIDSWSQNRLLTTFFKAWKLRKSSW